MNHPHVSIICLCYNQAPFIKDALESVWSQSYPDIELIVVDDGSTDGSVEVIRELLQDKPYVRFLPLAENVGNCRAFNKGFAISSGKFIIDLAADDVLLSERVAMGVKEFETAGVAYGVNFSDALYIDVKGNSLRGHYKRNDRGELKEVVPQGWVYAKLLERYFVCTPSMMFRREVLEELGGYDEALAYEDFDFWIRSSRNWKYCFTNEILVKKRIVPQSWSAQQYSRRNAQLASTLVVCQKAKSLNSSRQEDKALARRLNYEIRQAIRSDHFEMGAQLLALKKEVWPYLPEDLFYGFLIKHQVKALKSIFGLNSFLRRG